MVIADHISKSFDKRIVLNDISFAIGAGEITALIGLNGSGKTTMSKIIAGMLEADSGYIRVADKDPMLFQKEGGSVIGYMDNRQSDIGENGTVRTLFELCRKMYHVSADYYNYVLDYAGKQLKIQDFLDKSKNELSPGEGAKAKFLYTLLMRPVLWIMDEPTVGVDYESRLKMYELIRHFKDRENEKNMTILIVTHNIQEMEYLCEKAIVLHDGHIVFSGKLEWLQEKYKSLGTICFEIVSGAIYVQDMPLKRYWMDGNRVKILYDKRYVSAVVILKQLLETAELKNISIMDMDMETMIKNIFQ
uniref:ATP-binding cassette domain-containing protein n=1 Tax=Acetatifactor sp. TaxID=1872090 RepID=UPI0040575BFE